MRQRGKWNEDNKEKEYILNYCQNKENWPFVYRNPVPYVLISIIIGVLFGYSFGQAFDDIPIFLVCQ